MQTLAANARARRIEQRKLQDAAMDRDLWPTITCGDPARFTPDGLATLRVEGEFPTGDAGRFDLGTKPQLLELAHGVGQEVDPDAERSDLGHGFEDTDREARLVQAERCHEPADT